MVEQVTLPPRAWAGLLLLALVWGFSFLAMRVALNEIGPFTLVAHRVGWAALALWAVVRVAGISVPRTRRVWGAFAVMGLLNNIVPFSLIAFGQQHIETGLGSILNASTAIWGVLVAAVLLADERLTPRKATGVVLGFIGVSVAIGIDTLRTFDLRSVSQLAFLGAGMSYAFAGVWARRRLRGIAPEAAAVGMLTCSAVMAIPLALSIEGVPTMALSAHTWLALGYASLGATGIAYLLFYRVLALAGSGNTMLTTLLVAPVAITAGAVFLGETLALRAYFGFALVALGLVILDGRVLAAIKRHIRGRSWGPVDEPNGVRAPVTAQKPLSPQGPPR